MEKLEISDDIFRVFLKFLKKRGLYSKYRYYTINQDKHSLCYPNGILKTNRYWYFRYNKLSYEDLINLPFDWVDTREGRLYWLKESIFWCNFFREKFGIVN